MLVKLFLVAQLLSGSVTKEYTPSDMLLLSRLACSEAGTVEREVKRVLRVVYNRSLRNGTTPVVEAKKPYQFYMKNCRGKREEWLRWYHITFALQTLSGTIKADPVLNNKDVTHFGTTSRLSKPHGRCKGYSIREVWQWYGLTLVLKTEVGHEFYKKGKGKPGCPKKSVETG